MKRVLYVFAFWVAVAGFACAQARSQAEGGCSAVEGTFGPLRCPNGSSCGTYSTLTTEPCTIDNQSFCDMLIAFPVCCGKYSSLIDSGDQCLITELRDRDNRLRILELAEDEEVLVASCGGAYFPARIALRDNNKGGGGGL
jgi:hypothetical protein